MAQQQRKRARIWWLSGLLAALGACIVFFAAMEQFTATLIVVAVAVIVTGLLAIALAKTET